jgi:purine-binding chemotaxis protein CheW
MRKRRTSTSRYRTDQAKNLVGFLVGDVSYAVPIERVREIVNPLPMVALPHAPPEVVGVADHRGEVLPVVDLRVRFGLPDVQHTRKTKWIVVRLLEAGRSAALVVDAVTDVFGAGERDERMVPELGTGQENRGIQTVYAHDKQLVFVIEPDAVAHSASKLDERLVLSGLPEVP